MKRSSLAITFLCLVLLFTGCNGVKTDSLPSEIVVDASVPAVTEPKPDPVQIYQDAISDILLYERARIEVSTEKTVSVADQIFEESSQFDIIYKNLGTDDFHAFAEGSVKFGIDYSVELHEIYSDNAVYGFYDDWGYNAEIEQDAFFARYAPVVLLNPEHYNEVTLTEDNVISFAGASDLENWIKQDAYILLDASGNVELDEENHITQSVYHVSYSYGGVVHTHTYTTKVSPTEDLIRAADKNAANQPVYDADLPMMVHRAYGYVLQSDMFSLTQESMVASDAASAIFSIRDDCFKHYVDQLYYAEFASAQFLDAASGQTESYTVNEWFKDGMHYVSENGEEPVESQAYTSDITPHLDRVCNGFYPQIQYWKDIYISEVNGGTVIDYTFDASYGEYMRQNAQNMMFDDDRFLDRECSHYETQLREGYLAIDEYTGLPTVISSSYTGLHVIDDTEYLLSMQTKDTVNAVAPDAYTIITGEKQPIAEEPEQPTPVFYRVSGDDDQQMWLLGTIHVGDSRSTNLPQEIYDAFESSDALAVEFDVDDFEEQLFEDLDLAEDVLQAYFYSDGTTIDQHLSTQELYLAAVQTLKLTGQLSDLMLVTKPVIWSQAIEDFYMQQGHALDIEYGVDMQLLELAQRTEKPILNVESGLEQLELLTGYSDEIQEMLLVSTLATDPLTYNAQLMEMFELWCMGDEAALADAVRIDTSQMSPEELELYEEYAQAMETDRNLQMHQVAESYLNSGEIVFYAVGLAHLLAEDGLVNSLRNAGYTVELVSYQ